MENYTLHGSPKVPLALPCGHTLCNECYQSIEQLKCPWCRESFRPNQVKRLAVEEATEDSRTSPPLAPPSNRPNRLRRSSTHSRRPESEISVAGPERIRPLRTEREGTQQRERTSSSNRPSVALPAPGEAPPPPRAIANQLQSHAHVSHEDDGPAAYVYTNTRHLPGGVAHIEISRITPISHSSRHSSRHHRELPNEAPVIPDIGITLPRTFIRRNNEHRSSRVPQPLFSQSMSPRDGFPFNIPPEMERIPDFTMGPELATLGVRRLR